jgi:hypothetical protein
MGLVGASSRAMLQQVCRMRVEAALEQKLLGRQSHGTESVAVGCLEYVEAFRKQLGIRGKGREMMPVEGAYQLRETETAYQGLFESQRVV